MKMWYLGKKTVRHRLWILSTVILLCNSPRMTLGNDCPLCEVPNPNYDPNNPYESEPKCIPKKPEDVCKKVYGKIKYGKPQMVGPETWYMCGSAVLTDSTCPSGVATYNYDCFGTREYRPYCQEYWYEITDVECINMDCPKPGCEYMGIELVNDYTVPTNYQFFECIPLNPGEVIV